MPVVKLSDDGASFTLLLSLWSECVPVSALSQRLRFYRSLRDRRGGAYAAFYAPTVRALEDLARSLDNAKITPQNP